jgi:DNA-3-methyladenine glycosylase
MSSLRDLGGPLPRSFYARPVLAVARDCIGKILVRASDDGISAGRIVEAEAYRGPEDRAAHSYLGRRTARTEVMFGPPGHAYVFFVYGMHWNFNVVTGRAGEPHAVLIRAIEPILGLDLMSVRRGIPRERPELTNGPGKLCQALGITRADYGADLCQGRLFLAEPQVSGRRASPDERSGVARSARIGIDYAGDWVEKPWRFYERDNRYVSRGKAGQNRA